MSIVSRSSASPVFVRSSVIQLSPRSFAFTNLELGVALHEQHIDCLYIIDVSVFLKLFSHFRSDSGNRHVEGIHLLDFRALFSGLLAYARSTHIQEEIHVQILAILGRILRLVVVHLPN